MQEMREQSPAGPVVGQYYTLPGLWAKKMAPGQAASLTGDINGKTGMVLLLGHINFKES